MWMKRHLAHDAMIALALAVLAGAGSSPATARTWRVERDGSGDFTTIKPAIAAASAGDTIEIGPGRYVEVEPFSLPGWTEPTYVGVDKDNLTIRGTDRDAVIIGPTTPTFVGFGPKGFVTQVNVARMTVENLTVENVHDGLYLIGEVLLKGCLLKGCDLGVLGVDGLSLRAEGCEIYRCREGIIVFDGHDLEVTGSTFREHSVGVSYIRCTRGNVRNCVFSQGGGGAKYSQSTGTVANCTFTGNQNYALISHQASQVEATGNSVAGGTYGFHAVSSAMIVGTGNAVTGTLFAAIFLQAKSTCSFHLNDIVPAQGYTVRADSYLTGSYALDFTNNYWGTETSAEIAARIWDSRDDPSIHATVLFEPFAIQSVPNEPISVGELKSRFQQEE